MIRLKPPYKDANEEFKAKYIQMKTNTLRVCLVMGAFALLIAVIYGIVYYFKNNYILLSIIKKTLSLNIF